MRFRNILNGRLASNTQVLTKRALRHDIGYQKYAIRQALGEQKYRQNEKKDAQPGMAGQGGHVN